MQRFRQSERLTILLLSILAWPAAGFSGNCRTSGGIGMQCLEGELLASCALPHLQDLVGTHSRRTDRPAILIEKKGARRVEDFVLSADMPAFLNADREAKA
jgi:hypothetical protein